MSDYKNSGIFLLDCPFCGGVPMAFAPSAKITDDPKLGGRLYPVVRCGKCFAEVGGHDSDFSKLTAISKWNSRH